ncbi:MAG: hypothetical protein HYY03_05130, partial [Chloroflexi bacterium]|nr:hypothetical protein [Chloroflexota bacterium]
SGAIHAVKSAGDVVREMIEVAEEVLARLAEKHLELQATGLGRVAKRPYIPLGGGTNALRIAAG